MPVKGVAIDSPKTFGVKRRSCSTFSPERTNRTKWAGTPARPRPRLWPGNIGFLSDSDLSATNTQDNRSGVQPRPLAARAKDTAVRLDCRRFLRAACDCSVAPNSSSVENGVLSLALCSFEGQVFSRPEQRVTGFVILERSRACTGLATGSYRYGAAASTTIWSRTRM